MMATLAKFRESRKEAMNWSKTDDKKMKQRSFSLKGLLLKRTAILNR